MTKPLPLAAAHAARGGVLSDAGLPLHYGAAQDSALAAEYAAARERAALVDLSDRGLLRVTGPQRVKFLHGLLSQDLASRAAGQGCPAALMDAKGHLLATMRVLVDENEIVLELPGERLEPIEALLQHYRVAAPVRFAGEDAVVLGLVGPKAAELVEGVPPGDESHAMQEIAGVRTRVIRAGDLPGGGLVLHAPAEGGVALWEELERRGARPAGRLAVDALRVEAGHPWYGSDIGPDNLLHEAGLVSRLHSPTKGCYIGQEVIARLEARGGHVNKHLRAFRLSAAAAPGTTVRVGEIDAGRLTTTAVSPRLGPIALGYIHRDHAADGTKVTVEGAPAVVSRPPLG